MLSTYNPGGHTATTYTGNGAALTALTRANISAGTPNQIVVNDGAGLFSSTATVSAANGGTGYDSSASTGVAKVSSGTWSASQIVNADVSSSAAIGRSKLATGTASQVVINDPAGVLTSEAQLAPARGGTGIDTALSVGVAKVNTGVWSVSTIVNNDINPTAAIARSKIATSSPNHVVVNNGSGALTSEAQLAVSRGGTGQDFSASGVGPFAAQVSAGVFSIVSATPTAAATTYVTRDASGNTAVNQLTASTVTATGDLSVTPVGNLTLNPTGGTISTASSVVMAVPSGIAGGKVTQYTVNLLMSGAAFVPFWSLVTTTNTSYLVYAQLTGIDTGGTATIAASFQYRAKNIAGTVSKAADQNVTLSREAPIAAASARGNVGVTTLLVEVQAVAARSIKWCGRIVVAEQSL